MKQATLRLTFGQMGHHLVEQALSLVRTIHRAAPQSRAEGAARRHKVPVLVKQAAGVVQISIQRDTLSV
ncbi:hypothetical protein SDC9_210922 [bioreactor metagenome]|uniref:Uncharacterized protein n=1 Tax=bioreactor metagenome TaxID=1076179 RepID=A0A645JIJ4_9ZZZZ